MGNSQPTSSGVGNNGHVHFRIPQPDPKFCSREKELTEIRKNLVVSEKTDPRFTAVSIDGVAGIGKTEAVKKYVQTYQDRYESVVWIDASTESTLTECFETLAGDLQIPLHNYYTGWKRYVNSIAGDVFRHFARVEGSVLFVFDNCESYGRIEKFSPLPFAGRLKQHFIFTSRYEKWMGKNERFFTGVTIESCNYHEIIAYMKSIINSDFDEKNLVKVMWELGFNSLALRQAAGYINEKQITIEDYLSKLRDSQQALDLLEFPIGAKSSLDRFEETLKSIGEEGTRGKLALKLIQFLAYSTIYTPRCKSLFYHLKKGHNFDEELQLLNEFSLISFTCGRVDIKKITQKIIRAILKKNDTEKDVLGEFLTLIDYRRSRALKYEISIAWSHACQYPSLVDSFVYPNFDFLQVEFSNDYLSKDGENFDFSNLAPPKFNYPNFDFSQFTFPDWFSMCFDAPSGGHRMFPRPSLDSPNHLTSLECLAKIGYVEGMEWMIKYLRNKQGDSLSKDIFREPFLIACEKGHASVIRLFEKLGLMPYLCEREGIVALMHACDSGRNAEIVRILLENKVDPNYRLEQGRTYLMYSCKSYSEGVAKLLLESGVDPHQISDKGETAVLFACHYFYHSLELVKVLFEKGCSLDVADEKGKTPLMSACESKNFDLVKFLFENGCSLHIPDSKGKTPLMYACSGGNVAVVEFFLDNGCSLDVADPVGRTPLMFACEGASLDLVKFLLNKGCLSDVKDSRGKTMLMFAASARSNEKMVRFLIEMGADVKVRDMENKTALQWANPYEMDYRKYLRC